MRIDPHPDASVHRINQYGPGPWWWACEHPESPPDAWCGYVHECDRCTLAMVAVVATAAGPDVVYHRPDSSPMHEQALTRAGALAECRAFRAGRGLRPL